VSAVYIKCIGIRKKRCRPYALKLVHHYTGEDRVKVSGKASLSKV